MKKSFINFSIFTVILVSVLSFSFTSEKRGKNLSNSVTNSSQNKFTVWIYFTDKGENAFSKLSEPLNLVSQRSLERRIKVKSADKIVDISDVPVSESYINVIKNNVEKIRNRSKWLNAVSAEIDRAQIENIIELNFVKKIELVERFKREKEDIEFSLSHPESYNSLPQVQEVLTDSLNYGTGNAVIQMTQIKVNQVHNDGIFGQGIMIANFDAGFFNLTHEVFTTNPMNIVTTYDFQNHTPVLTGHSHGTATLSAVGGYKPGQLISPAFKSKFILARTEVDPTENPFEMDNWIAAAEWADSLGADVITSSLGYLDFDPPNTSYTWTDMDGNTLPITKVADLAVNKGIVVSNSAGNNGSSSHNTLIGPADGDSVITVGAVNSDGSRAGFSSVGPTTDLPSRIKPDVMAMGSSDYLAGTSGNNYVSASGTSFSCPINAGVCALILCANKNLTPIQVRDILRKFGNNSNSPNNNTGWGILDAKRSVDTARKLDLTPPVIQYTPQIYIRGNSPVKVKCLITDNGIIRNRTNEAPVLYYRKYINSAWSTFTALNYYQSGNDTFYFSIPTTIGKSYVEYYFAAQDIALPSPLVSTLPAGGSGINPPGSNPPPVRFNYKVDTHSSQISDLNESSFAIKNYPNPFNPLTNFEFEIPVSGFVTLKIYDVSGKEISTIVNASLNQGNYKYNFDGSNFSSGVYFYKLVVSSPNSLKVDNYTLIKQMILLK